MCGFVGNACAESTPGPSRAAGSAARFLTLGTASPGLDPSSCLSREVAAVQTCTGAGRGEEGVWWRWEGAQRAQTPTARFTPPALKGYLKSS